MCEYSFIIPAHNAAATIVEAVRSIEDRVSDAEIIVVENASTDNTFEIVKALSEIDKNIILLQSEKGVSNARNMGMKRATGKWIIFVDADDRWIANKETLRGLLKDSPDIVIASYKKGKGSVIHKFEKTDVPSIRAWMMERPTQRMTVWAKIYKRSFLLENTLLFNEALWVSEDSEFLVRCLNICESILISDNIIYDNLLNESSVTRSLGDGRMEGHLEALRIVAKEVPQDKTFQDYVLNHFTLISVHEIFDPRIKCSWKMRINKLKSFLQEEPVNSQISGMHFSRSLQLLPPYLCKIKLYSSSGFVCYLRGIMNRLAYIK